MQPKHTLERPLNWFVLQNESYTRDVTLEYYLVEESEQETGTEETGVRELADDCFDKDYITCKRRKKRDYFYY